MTVDWRRDQFFGLLVVFVSFLVYANSLGNGFVWDDTNVIVHNPALRGSPLSLFSGIDTTRDYEVLPYYRPLTVLTFLIEERLHGLTPFPMHLVNVLLHAANALLVYLLARSLVIDTYAALLAGLLFAVHPINTEAVDFISARNTLLSGSFILAAYLLHRRSIIRENLSGAFAGAVFLLAGLFSKETALAGLPFIMAQEIAQLRSTSGRLRAIGRLLPYVAGTTGYLVMRWITLSSLGVQTSIIPGFGAQKLQGIYMIPDFWTRLLDNLYIIPRYLFTVVWPTALSPRYLVPDRLQFLAVPLAAAWIFIITAVIWLLTRGRSRATLFGLSWFVVFWLPISGIIWFPGIPMADRYLYIPAIGLWIVAADQAVRLFPFDAGPRRYVVMAATLVVLVLAVLTVKRNLDWKDDISLFSRFTEQYPDNAYGHAGLGEAYLKARDIRYLNLAEQEFEKVLALNARVPGIHAKMGYIRHTQGDYEGAVYYYTIALAIYPLDKETLLNRGIVLENLGRQKDALEDFRRFLAIPGYELAEARPYAEARIRELTR